MEIRSVRGAELAPWLDDVARLRIAVFREFPYLYDGDLSYEAKYLQSYLETPDSICVLALDGDRVVGASTGLPLSAEGPSFRKPFEDRGIAASDVFYCAESVLLPSWRGRGVGHRFFDERENHARSLGAKFTAFAAVDRDHDDPRRGDARDNAEFWMKRGYVRQPGMSMQLSWREIGRSEETPQTLTYWMRELA